MKTILHIGILASLLLLLTLLPGCDRASPLPSVTTEEQIPPTSTVEQTDPSTEAPPALPSHLTYSDIVLRMLDPRHLSLDVQGERAGQFSSYDRASAVNAAGTYRNWGANLDANGILEKTAEGDVVAELSGAGYLSRIWCAMPKSGHIRIYIDGESEPRIDLPFLELFGGTRAPFDYPSLCYVAAHGYNFYQPITFSTSCRVVLTGDWGAYYHIGYTLLPDSCTVEPFPSTLSERDKSALMQVDEFYRSRLSQHPLGAKPTQTLTARVDHASPLRTELEGSGAISALTVKLSGHPLSLSEETIRTLKNLVLRITYDGKSSPSVEMPLGDFFGCGYGINEIRTLLYGVAADGTLYNYFYMPYANGAVVEIAANEGTQADLTLSLSTEALTAAQVGSMRFCALFTRGQAHEQANRAPDNIFLRATGAGRLVALNLHLYKYNAYRDMSAIGADEWWGEGDEKLFVDGEAFPSIFGTGTEDFFGYAWCSGELFNRALHSQSYCRGDKGGIGNRVLSRLMLSDAVPFSQSFEGCLEKYYDEEYVSYGYGVFFYLDKDGSVQSDRCPTERYDDYFQIESAYTLQEAEKLSVSAHDGPIPLVQEMSLFGNNWGGGSQLFWQNGSIGQSITLSLPAERDGDYVLLASFTRAPDYGSYIAAVNGITLAENLNLYSPVVEAYTLTELGTITLKAGRDNCLTITCTGKDSRASGYFLGLDFLLLLPTDSYRGVNELALSPYFRDNYGPVRVNAAGERFDLTRDGADIGSGVLSGPTVGALSLQSLGYFSRTHRNDSHIWWTGGNVGASLSATLTVEEGGRFDGVLSLTCAADFATVEVLLNGRILQTVDCYANTVTRKEVVLSDVTLQQGSNSLVLRIAGKNVSSSGYLVGFDYLALEQRES